MHRQHTAEIDHGRTTAIEATDLGLTYSNGTEAVTDVTLEIPSGEFFGFLGPNGAGKTTTIKMLATLLRPTAGQITVNGYDARADSQSVRESIGYMGQETSVDPALTVGENLRFVCRAYGVPTTDRRGRIDGLLELVGLAERAGSRAGTLSVGQKKRLDAATTLVHQPPIVFLDEPTAGLDPAARTRLWEYFREINRRGTTVFLTTQYLEEADALCSELAVILDGGIVATGSPADLKARVGGNVLEIGLADPTDATVERARTIVERSGIVTSDGTRPVRATENGLSVASSRARRIGPDLLVRLTEAGIAVTEFTVRSPTLDDVFLALTGESGNGGEDERVRSTERRTGGLR